MDKIAYADALERKSLFLETADKLKLSEFIVEKDFWVSWILGKIFSDKHLSQILCFKGGTSLSKVFGLIDRFSEDIDLILSQSVILKDGEKLSQSSSTKQAEFNKVVERRAQNFINTALKRNISKVLEKICSVYSEKDDEQILYIRFPRVFDYSYVQPDIKLEIGPLALWDPNDKYPVNSFIANALPKLELENPIVPTIKPERTFWEKATILHHEHHRPENSTFLPRYSRHYYDLFKMANSDVKNCALADLRLLKEVVAFKKRFYPRGWAKYDEAIPGTFRLIPAKHNSTGIADDYVKMQKMLFGEIPAWDTILLGLQKLEEEINNLHT